MSSVSASLATTSATTTTSSSRTIPSVTYDEVTSQQLTNATGNLLKFEGDLSTLSARDTAYANLDSALQSLIGALPLYEDQTQVAGLTASSNSSLIGVTMGAQGVAGTYTINVTSMARPQINQSNSKASTSIAGNWGNGTLGIKVGSGPTANVSVSTSMTVQQLADAINNANAGVTAAVGGSGLAYYVTVTGNKTGSVNGAVTFTENGVTTGLGGNVTQTAGNTNYTVNGASYSSQNFTSPNGVPGATLNFSGVVTGAVVTIAANPASIVSSLTSFVSNYNSAMSAVNTAIANSPQFHDPLLALIKKQLSRIVGNVSTGASATFRALADVGITRNSDDTLSVNSNTLAAAASTNAASVASLLTGTALGTNGLAADLNTVAAAFAEPGVGLIDRDRTSMARYGLRLARSISNTQSTVDRLSDTIGDKYTTLQVALSRYALQSLLVSSLTSQEGITAASTSSSIIG